MYPVAALPYPIPQFDERIIMKRIAARQGARASTRAYHDAIREADENERADGPNRKTRRAIERAPEPRRTNVERQNRSDARPVNARKLKVRAARHARDIEARRAERYGNV